jgi:tryptophan-rich sensory protein
VWSILYAQMGTSAWLVWDEARRDPAKREDAHEALGAWVVQLALNGAWSPVFFGRRSLGGGLAISSAMLPAIGTTAALSGRVSSLSRALYAPYLAWVSFATILNGRIWQLNRNR